MIRKSLILFLFIFEICNASAQSCSKLRRICRANLNNEIFWRYNLSVPCGTFKEYRIFGRDKPSSSSLLYIPALCHKSMHPSQHPHLINTAQARCNLPMETTIIAAHCTLPPETTFASSIHTGPPN